MKRGLTFAALLLGAALGVACTARVKLQPPSASLPRPVQAPLPALSPHAIPVPLVSTHALTPTRSHAAHLPSSFPPAPHPPCPQHVASPDHRRFGGRFTVANLIG